ncbi:MAG: ABC transporter ATP-binding protein [Clostridia bacterium]|nr:ABC transporter ATP-binding protein [Clostridia bacterium]
MSDNTNKPAASKHGFHTILPCAKGYILPTLLTPLLMICEVAMEVFIPLLMAAIVDGGLYRKPDFQLRALFSAELIADSTRFILTLGALMIAAALLSLAFGMLGARTAAVAAMGFSKNLRHSIFERIQAFSFKNTDKFSTPSLVMRATTDVNNVQNLYMQSIRVFVRAPVMMVLAAIMAFRIDSKLSLIFVLCLPVLVTVLIAFTLIGRPRFRIFLKKYDELTASVQEDLTAIRVVKSYVREEYEKKRFNASAEDLKRAHMRAERLFALTNPLQLGVMWTCSIILLLLGGDKVLGGRLNTGELVSMLTYTNQVIGALAMCAAIIVIVTMTRESVVRITEVLSEVPDIAEVESELKVESGEIEFRDVCFSYTGSEDNLTLRNIDLHIRSGETIGIIGGTGEGKSTLVQLIPRFYDVLSGELLIGGRDIKEYSLYELRESVSMVLQKNMLFSGTIKDNLRWGDPNASDEDIERACRLACAHDFVSGFPDGYDTELGQGGVNVSGGQKQRLCIARALLKKPKILILDDSTSAVDSRTEESIRNAFREFIPTTTKLIIAQRISSIMDADRIIVMDKGCISDVGTHDELMERSEIYREVYTSQHKEVKEDE